MRVKMYDVAVGSMIGLAFGAIIGVGLTQEGSTMMPPASAQPLITEDDPRWNCAVDGDHVCGPNAKVDAPAHCWSIEATGNYTPGSRVWLQGGNMKIEGCKR